ncbi:hypothetical protein ACHMW6_03495 [Pseudoduganella sp. UC29_106]|uniref:hypothetical protein n=1 Tax=Pseudoduganella sp. UC29_106 TaxID=3374553 RepID=UPI003756E0E0
MSSETSPAACGDAACTAPRPGALFGAVSHEMQRRACWIAALAPVLAGLLLALPAAWPSPSTMPTSRCTMLTYCCPAPTATLPAPAPCTAPRVRCTWPL